jgi:hypothetical protein
MITETDNNFDIEPEENEDIREDISYADGRFEDEYEDDPYAGVYYSDDGF